MERTPELPGHYIRVVALVSLLLGLSDAARLLGVSSGETSPIALLGTTGFVYLAIFSLARLFAAVGLWIRASWGAVILVGATGAEVTLFLLGSRDVEMSLFGLTVRLVLLASIIVLLLLGMRLRAARVQD